MQPPNKTERAASISMMHPVYSGKEGHLFGIHQIRRTIRESEMGVTDDGKLGKALRLLIIRHGMNSRTSEQPKYRISKILNNQIT